MTGTHLVPAASTPTQLMEAAVRYAEGGTAANTRRAYRSDWTAFTRWCASVDRDPLPAEAATVALYLTARAPDLAPSTLARHLAAIRCAHRVANLSVPDSSPLRSVWNGIRRTHGRPVRKKRGLLTADLKKVVARLPASLVGLRDRAILLVGFASAMRRSEIAALSIDAGDVRVTFEAEGLEISVDRSKGDQLGKGVIIAIPFGARTATCPVLALEAWLKATGIHTGPIFRPIDRHGRLGDQALSDRSVANIVKAGAGSIGLDPKAFAGHSLRRGVITSAHRGGAAPEQLQALARHGRFDTTREYIEAADRFKTSAAGKAGL